MPRTSWTKTIEFIEDNDLINELVSGKENPNSIYIIGNPVHWLGFMVVSPDDPLGVPRESVGTEYMQKEVNWHI